jgi:hypothetical protein
VCVCGGGGGNELDRIGRRRNLDRIVGGCELDRIREGCGVG